MATKIRLRRMGAKKQPFFRIVVVDSRCPRDGRFIEEIGYYNPLKNPSIVKINEERALDWLSEGVEISDTVRSLFKREGLLQKNAEAKAAAKASKAE